MRKLPSIKGLVDRFNTLLAKTAVAPPYGPQTTVSSCKKTSSGTPQLHVAKNCQTRKLHNKLRRRNLANVDSPNSRPAGLHQPVMRIIHQTRQPANSQTHQPSLIDPRQRRGTVVVRQKGLAVTNHAVRDRLSLDLRRVIFSR